MKVRLKKRTAIELGAGLVSLVLAVLILLVMANVHRWDGAVTRGDARFAVAPPDVSQTSGLPAPPPARWKVPTGFTADVAERLLGLRDDMAFRRALSLYRAVNPNPNEQLQYNEDPELPAKRIRAQQAPTAVAKNDLPYADALPVRTFPTASTTGLFAAASAAPGGMGVKLFWAVTA